MIRSGQHPLAWQSKAILLIVVPWTVISAAVQGCWWATHEPQVAWTTLGVSAIFGLIVWKMRAGTPAAAATGAAITASLIFSTTQFPYQWSWLHGGLMPLLAVFLLTYAATRIGRAKKERQGTSESRRGRNAAQVAANLGVAALAPSILALTPWSSISATLAIAALAEAAADTASSEIGQIFGGQPRMITSLRRVAAGTDGGITLAGTAAGVLAAAITASIGLWATHASRGLFGIGLVLGLTLTASIFGLFFDSLIGATLERKGWLNNDAVNFISTLSAVVFAFGELVYWVSQTRL